MIIGFDFDRVLFKTDSFKEFLDEKVPGFLESYPEEGRYDPKKHAENLGVEESDIFEALEHASEFVYDDLEELEEFPEEFELVIVSRGDPDFQARKIKNSNVLKYFESFFIVENERKDFVGIDFLIDDREEEVNEVEVPGYVFDRSEEDLEELREKVVDKVRSSEQS